MLAVTGLPWPDPGHLTLSFVPDGADVGGAPSALGRALDPALGQTWRTTVLRAFQAWAATAKIEIGVVADNGQPLGRHGPAQGGQGVGDIRIAARPLAPNTLALSTPFDMFSSWSGDVVLNSDVRFGDGAGGTQDLFAAVLHEAGHVFGLEHDGNDPTSAMSPQVLAGRTGPSALDVAALQSLYGPRESSTASPAIVSLSYLATPGDLANAPASRGWGWSWPSSSSSSSTTGPAASASIAAANERDAYFVRVPAGAGGSFSVTARASGISLLTPRLTVFDALGQVVGATSAADPLQNDLTVTVPASMPGATFVARVEASGPDAGAFGIGAYRIAAGAPDLARAATVPPATLGRGLGDDGGRNDQPARATTLRPLTDLNRPGWPYALRAEIEKSKDVDFYKIRTDKTTPPVMIVTAWGLQADRLTPRVDVFDAKGSPASGQLLSNTADGYTIQLPRTEANSWYTVRVSALDSAGDHATGPYFLGVSFRAAPIATLPFTEGVLDASRTEDFRTLTVPASQLFQFSLTADAAGAPGDTAVRMTIYDASKKLVTTFNTLTGTSSVLLTPGAYTVRFVAGTRSGSRLPMLLYHLRGLIRSEAIGPPIADTTTAPATPNPTCPPPAAYDWRQDDYFAYAYYLSLGDAGLPPF